MLLLLLLVISLHWSGSERRQTNIDWFVCNSWHITNRNYFAVEHRPPIFYGLPPLLYEKENTNATFYIMLVSNRLHNDVFFSWKLIEYDKSHLFLDPLPPCPHEKLLDPLGDLYTRKSTETAICTKCIKLESGSVRFRTLLQFTRLLKTFIPQLDVLWTR